MAESGLLHYLGKVAVLRGPQVRILSSPPYLDTNMSYSSFKDEDSVDNVIEPHPLADEQWESVNKSS